MRYLVNPDTGELDIVGTASAIGAIDQIDADPGQGSATPVAGVVNILGGEGIDTSAAGNSVTISGENASDTNKGIASFDAGDFTVVNGHVTFNGTGAGETLTADDLIPLSPTAGNWNIFGGTGIDTSGAGSTLTIDFDVTEVPEIPTNITTDSGSLVPTMNNFSILGGTGIDVTHAGTVITISNTGGPTSTDSFAMQAGTNPVVPDANGLVTFNGSVVAAGTNPVRTNGTGANTMQLEVQRAQAIAATDATKVGLCNFDSADFSVDANGFVSLSGAVPMTDLHTARYIVGDTSDGANYSTIAAAYADAVTDSAGGTIPQTVFIQPKPGGTAYTENLTLSPLVNLCAFDCDADTPNVKIIGKLSASFTGACSISGIWLQTNADYFLEVTGANVTQVNLSRCYFNCSNNTGINYTTTNASAQLNINYCQGDVGTTGITLFTSSSTGRLDIFFSDFTNTGGSSEASIKSAGSLFFQLSRTFIPINGTGSTNIIKFLNIDTQDVNATGFTGGGEIHHSFFTTGSASSISIPAASSCSVNNCVIRSGNTNAIAGAGTIEWAGLSFWGSSRLIGTTTQTSVGFRPGRVVWDEITGTSQTALPNSQYIANNAGLVTITLPATFQVGDIVRVAGVGAGLWSLVAATGNVINFGSSPTSSGGSLTATNRYDCVDVVAVSANATWVVTSSIGNLTVA